GRDPASRDRHPAHVRGGRDGRALPAVGRAPRARARVLAMKRRRALRVAAAVLLALAAAAGIAVKLVFAGERSARTGVTGTLFRDATRESRVFFRFHG